MSPKEAATLTARKISSKHTFWLVLGTPLLASLKGSMVSHAAQTLWENVDFEFIRECMKINKIRLKFQFCTQIEIKMTYLVFVFCYLLSLHL